MFDYLEDHLAIIGGLAVAVAVVQVKTEKALLIPDIRAIPTHSFFNSLQLFGIIFACIVRRDVKEGYNYV